MLSLLLSHWPLNRRLLIGLLPILLLWFFVALQPGGDSEELRFLLIATLSFGYYSDKDSTLARGPNFGGNRTLHIETKSGVILLDGLHH